MWQSEEAAPMNAAGHQIIASTFRRAAAQNRRLHVNKVVLSEVVSHRFDNRASQDQRLLHRFATKVDVTVLQVASLRLAIRLGLGRTAEFGERLSKRTSSARISISPVANLALILPSSR